MSRGLGDEFHQLRPVSHDSFALLTAWLNRARALAGSGIPFSRKEIQREKNNTWRPSPFINVNQVIYLGGKRANCRGASYSFVGIGVDSVPLTAYRTNSTRLEIPNLS